MIVVSVIGIILAFAVLIFAAYKKISMFLAAVLAAAIVALFGGLDVAASLVGADGPFLIGMKDFVGSWLVIFALGALLGALYDKSGATWRISSTLINKAGTQWTLLIYVLVGALLVYGGIQVTVMIFVLLPFAKILFPKAGIPWYLFPGITGLAIATFAMGQMPGSLQMQNIIPTQILGTALTAAPVEGVGHYEPLRHYAEVHLLLEPLPRGSGLELAAACPQDMLDGNWQRLVLTHLAEKPHLGVLTGSPITDVRITLVAGRAHLKHTEGGDFRQATYRAVRQGLMEAESILLEPWYDFRLELPPEQVGRALSDLQRMGGQAGTPETAGALSVLTGSAPVAGLRDYGREVAAYTRGRGRLSCTAGGYAPCHNADEVIAALGYDPERDVDNPADSVFCAHGAGYNVKWSEVKAHAHVGSGLRLGAEPPPPEEAAPVRPRSVSYAASLEQDKELQAIFERTYGKVERGAFRPQPKPARTSLDDRKYSIQAQKQGPEYLLADGYNLIFAWEELKAVARDNLDAARQMLMEVLSNYQGFKQNIVILVFDAYRVPRSVQDVTKYHNIYVVYTKEAETADTYIERATYEIGRHHRVRVATSDGAEQLIILGHGALRLSASAFKAEVEQAAGQISAILAVNNRSAPSQPVAAALERARRRQEDKP